MIYVLGVVLIVLIIYVLSMKMEIIDVYSAAIENSQAITNLKLKTEKLQTRIARLEKPEQSDHEQL